MEPSRPPDLEGTFGAFGERRVLPGGRRPGVRVQPVVGVAARRFGLDSPGA